MRDRFFQALLILSSLASSWLGMMAVHESGHVLHLWLTGGTVDYVVLHPLEISYTSPGENPHPLVVAWGGAIWGCAIPLAVVALVRVLARSQVYLARFFAGFCLISNGAYLAADSFVRGGDGRDLMAYGVPQWLLILVGIPAIAAGLWLWNGLGPHFGLGESQHRVDRRAAWALFAALVIVVSLELVLSARLRR
jgi:hypothetical protein